jgi:hypothetical protein
MSGRLASAVLVTGLIRRAEAEGGFGAVLARGDATAGAILVLLLEKGARKCLLERLLQPDGQYAWQDVIPAGQDDAAFAGQLARRRQFDPDLWIVELDIASSERFAAEMNAAG